jgi:hypothetical protein
MSGRRRNTAVVAREYKAAPDYCARALELLLRWSVDKKAAGYTREPSGRDGTKVQGDSAGGFILPD